MQKKRLKHAWDHFLYHAQQRQTVFNFYVLLLAAHVAAFATTIGRSSEETDTFRIFLGSTLAITSFLFWRLDLRSKDLIDISENSLAKREEHLAKLVGEDSILIIKKSKNKNWRFPLSCVETFGQVYRLIFLLAGWIGNLSRNHSHSLPLFRNHGTCFFRCSNRSVSELE